MPKVLLPLWFRLTVIYALSCSQQKKNKSILWVQLFTKCEVKQEGNNFINKINKMTLRSVVTRLRAWLYSQTPGHRGSSLVYATFWSPLGVRIPHMHRRILAYCSRTEEIGGVRTSAHTVYTHTLSTRTSSNNEMYAATPSCTLMLTAQCSGNSIMTPPTFRLVP